MENKSLRCIVLSIFILTIVSCILSIADNNIYQDGEWANAQWLGQDLVTFFIVAPMLILSYYQAIHKRRWKWNMVLGGILFYFVYTYAFFAIVAEPTFLYLFHLPIFGLAIIGLFMVLFNLFKNDFHISNERILIKGSVIGYMLVVSMILAFLWLSDIFSYLTIAGYKSDIPNGKPPLIIYSLDLGIVIPLMLIAVVGYWKNKQYGYKLTAVLLTKTSTIGIALMAMAISLYVQKLDFDGFLIFLWCTIGLVGTVLTTLYLKYLIKYI